MHTIYEKYVGILISFLIHIVQFPPQNVPYRSLLAFLIFFFVILLREEHQVKAKTGESKLEYNWEGERGRERE